MSNLGFLLEFPFKLSSYPSAASHLFFCGLGASLTLKLSEQLGSETCFYPYRYLKTVLSLI